MVYKNYSLRYLPLFYEELNEKITYIANDLQNPKAANDLLDVVNTSYTLPAAPNPNRLS